MFNEVVKLHVVRVKVTGLNLVRTIVYFYKLRVISNF